MTTLRDLYVDYLKNIYDAENQLVKALETMAEEASSDTLKTAFETHRQETEGQIERLDKIFAELDESSSGETCEVMQVMVEEAEEVIESDLDDELLDTALIACAQSVEHFEIASYGTLCEFAKKLGFREQAKLLQETLDEEQATDKKLTGLAASTIKQIAQAA